MLRRCDLVCSVEVPGYEDGIKTTRDEPGALIGKAQTQHMAIMFNETAG